jgi:hypothetical protein
VSRNQLPPMELPTGIFTLSLDFELIWGTLDKPKHRRFRRLCAIERESVIDGLLDLFAEYQISATWCTVGHLFLDRKHDTDAMAPAGCDAGILYARDLIGKIRSCPTFQEIGSHTFTHRVFDDTKCTPSIANRELADSARVAAEMGLQMKSFAFPRNGVAHLDLLAKHGFTVFRGQDLRWYARGPRTHWYHRIGHLVDIFFQTVPATVLPIWHEEGIWEIPGSMLFTPSHGLRCVVPASARVRRAQRGLRAAVANGRIFHLWFHPTDLVVRKEAMLDSLRQILETASQLRESGRLVILPMSAVTERFELARLTTPVLGSTTAIEGALC